jgi:hypothetical protein
MADTTVTYLQLLDAIQAHIQAVTSDNMIARDWILVCGVKDVASPANDIDADIRIDYSPGTTSYALNGLLNLAFDMFQADTE